MNNKLYGVIAVVLGFVLVGVGGYMYGQNKTLGTVYANPYSLQSYTLYNLFNSIVRDLQNVRAPLAGIVQSTTAAIAFPAISSSTAGVTTTTVATIPAAKGDLVFVRPSTSSPGFSFDADVNTASTTGATFDINAHNNTLGAAAVAPSSTLFYITVIPRSSFAVPAALQTATSTNTSSSFQ